MDLRPRLGHGPKRFAADVGAYVAGSRGVPVALQRHFCAIVVVVYALTRGGTAPVFRTGWGATALPDPTVRVRMDF